MIFISLLASEIRASSYIFIDSFCFFFSVIFLFLCWFFFKVGKYFICSGYWYFVSYAGSKYVHQVLYWLLKVCLHCLSTIRNFKFYFFICTNIFLYDFGLCFLLGTASHISVFLYFLLTCSICYFNFNSFFFMNWYLILHIFFFESFIFHYWCASSINSLSGFVYIRLSMLADF